jgi:hypothetical protein
VSSTAASFACALLAPALIFSAPAAAQQMPGFDCNLYGPTQPCAPYLLYPPGQDLRLTVPSRDAEGRPDRTRDGSEINNLRELFAALRACWAPPPLEVALPGMELTIRFSFDRAGNIMGKPRFTYVSRIASAEQRDLYRRAVIDSLMDCTPLPLTRGMGGAIAGRPLVIRYIDDRNTRRAGA